ncbi:MAG TPA: glycosyltransferase family 9 protein [Gemmataceae bacterium]|nr:glycosyltransferase family 9 protein [Gemmataceae bacterium]
MTSTADWQQAENVLCVRLDMLGDVLMTTPALRAFKQSRPGRRLTLLTSPAAAALAPMVPEIDACIVCDAPWMKATAPRADNRPEFAVIERLRQERFDAAVIFTGPAHIAASVGTPVVDLYAQTNPQHTPWLVPHRLLYHDVHCKNCFKSVCPQGHHDCLARVPPQDVAQAALELMSRLATLRRSVAPFNASMKRR